MKKTLNLQEFRKVCRVGMKFDIRDFGENEVIGFSEHELYYRGYDGSAFNRPFYVDTDEITITHTPKITWDNLREGDMLESDTCVEVMILAIVNNLVSVDRKEKGSISNAEWRHVDYLKQHYTIIQPDTVEEKPKSDCCGVVERGIKLSHAEKLLSEYEGVKVTIIPD